MLAMPKVVIAIVIFFCLSFTSISQQIPNFSFEDVEDSIPENWSVSSFGAQVSTDFVTEGQFSLKVWNWYYYGIGAAVLGTGTPPFLMQKAGLPYQGEPNFLTGSYAYIKGETYSSNDKAVIGIALKKYNQATNTSDTIAFGETRLSPTENISGFQIPIQYNSVELCDTIVVWVFSSDSGFCGVNSNGNCLYLYVDNLTLQSGSTSSQNIDSWFSSNSKLIPNPTQQNFRIITKKELVAVKVLSLSGQVVFSANQQLTADLNVSDLPAGVYIVAVNYTDQSSERLKLVIQ